MIYGHRYDAPTDGNIVTFACGSVHGVGIRADGTVVMRAAMPVYSKVKLSPSHLGFLLFCAVPKSTLVSYDRSVVFFFWCGCERRVPA